MPFIAPMFQRRAARTEKYLQESPRPLAIVSALALGGLAVMLISSVGIFEWFYWTSYAYYRHDPQARLEWWAYDACELLLGFWLAGLAFAVARSRRDHALFRPATLRLWGVLFVLAPIGLIVMFPNGALEHFHVLSLCWGAAIACFTLAKRRAGAAVAPRETPAPSFRPPPIE